MNVMTVEFKLPSLGENIESGDVVSVLVKVGETVTDSQPILELETDKAVVEVPVDSAGTVEEIKVSEGDTIEVGQVVLILAPEGAGSESPPEKEVAQEPKEEAEVEEPEPGSQPESEVQETIKEPVSAPASSAAAVPASPAVRRFARELGVDLSAVPGTGRGGRILESDVKAWVKNRSQAGPSVVEAASLPDFSVFGSIERSAFNNVRRVTARHLSEAWRQVAHVTQHDTADVTGLEELRRRHSERVGAAGGKLTVTAIALKIAATALRRFPKFNASIDVGNEEVIFKHYYNVGVAVDTERGLLVPVIRDVDQKNIVELALELQEVAGLARDGKIGPDRLQGGTFTITNLGGIGGTSFTPIVNFPEVAILGLSRTALAPVYVDGELQARKMMPLSLSYDHRLIDGAEAARFLRWVAEAFEEPFLMALEG